ncbi:MAG: PH domain-containing protein [Balneolaceae bacterium]|nr:PH domain-containing protein [Balneolaceae bacterium]
MSEFERQHPIAAVSRAFGLIRGNFITILIFLFVGAQSDNFPFLWWIGGGFGLLLVLGVANWWRFLYKIEDGTLHIKSGIFVRKDLYLTKDRIQVIDVTSGLLQRMFGLVRLDIQTAGSSSRQAAIDAITKVKAAEVNRMLRQAGAVNTEDSIENQEFEDTPLTEQELLKRIKLPAKELLIAASTSGSFGIALSIIATVFSQIEPLISESELFEYLFGMLPSQTDTIMIITVIAVFVVFAWLLSFFSTLFTYGNFQLDVKEKEIVVSRGIFEKKRITVPFNRIQAIHITEGIIRQPLGYASVHLESAGYGDDKGTGSIVLYPLIRINNLKKLLNDVLPDYQKEFEGTRPPGRSARRYIFRSSFLVTAITGFVYWQMALNVWIWLIPVISLIWGWKKYSDAALGWSDDMFLLRNRRLSRSTAFIKKKRVQDASMIQSPFQKLRDLASVQVFVASGDRGKSFQVRDLEIEDAKKLIHQLRKNGVSTTDSAEDELKSNQPKLPGWN